MDRFDVGQARYFALYLPDGLPLLGKNARLEIDRDGAIPAVYLKISLSRDSAEDLDKSLVLGELYLPKTETALESYEVDLDLEANEDLCERFQAYLRDTERPAVELLDGEGPHSDAEKRNPFLNVGSYTLKSHAVRVQNLADDDVIALAKKPPKPL